MAPAGTVAEIKDLDTTLNVAAVPSKVTLVAPLRLLPGILRVVHTLPEVGRVSTNGPRANGARRAIGKLGHHRILILCKFEVVRLPV